MAPQSWLPGGLSTGGRRPARSRPARRLALLAALAPLALGACADDGSRAGNGGGELRVVTTTTHVADLVRQAGGGQVEVTSLLEPGADPHDYDPRPSDVAAIAEADIVFRSGGAVDDWLGELIESAGGSARTINLVEAVETLEHGGETDPHWWQDPRNAVHVVASVRAALATAEPDRRARYRRAATAYTRELRRLDRELAACFARVPASRRKLVTTHDSLAYLARRYDLEVVGAVIPSLSTQAQPSAGDVQELVDQIERERVSAVFPESGLSQKLERAIARESGAQVGGELWTDSLGGAGSGADTYVRAMRANADSLVSAMTGGARGCR